ncbi:transmembrane proetin, twin-arginine translocation pathway signal [Methyloglobulus morosus KoM1]|uniref:Transmembrane proetin, twin-arginine translocation pathway signal n=1 Tax=Methyloglobulus morosus KoM1 TaxID=1116472 RepID=V5BLB0_9GAMM|nr:thiosulfate oxidation carrier protein SoxY [Methyloglobulus morosus]ESS66947.1 transmembrane proetin, twin-arginine translocation pathway signal [Methyloglobulus morosus KoM1]
MKANRRKFLKTSLVLGTAGIGLLETGVANAEWNAADFAPNPFDAAMKQLLKGKTIIETDKIDLNIPEIAENGALVPVTVTSRIEGIQSIAIVVEQNPVPLAIQAELMPELDPFISARLKLASTSFVYAIAETEKVCYSVKKKVKVTIGGCGG